MAVGVLAVRLCCVKIRADSDLLAVQPRKTTNYQSRDSLSFSFSLFFHRVKTINKKEEEEEEKTFFFLLPLTLKKSGPIAVVGVCTVVVVVVVFCFFLLFQLFRSLVYDDDHLATADHQNYRVSSLFSPSSSSSSI
jgi:hypothetical protein